MQLNSWPFIYILRKNSHRPRIQLSANTFFSFGPNKWKSTRSQVNLRKIDSSSSVEMSTEKFNLSAINGAGELIANACVSFMSWFKRQRCRWCVPQMRPMNHLRVKARSSIEPKEQWAAIDSVVALMLIFRYSCHCLSKGPNKMF